MRQILWRLLKRTSFHLVEKVSDAALKHPAQGLSAGLGGSAPALILSSPDHLYI